ncbi:TetR/AcrR family transcriptional regulator [Piscinibacter gummiphilus]|nr:TetR/AcrR family transcriptional regulator [Piscinibacter gummiphilus]GLS94297.1 TetR family transcriptional regulator [Piscinibacter gummiphilus]
MRSEQKEQTRQRMRQAAAEGFRSHGYGIGVDGLAKRAGVTSGAFYANFSSKADAFREAVAFGMDELLGGIRYFQQEHGLAWWPEFVAFYLGEKLTCDLAQSCSLQTLTPELARADDAAKDVFREKLQSIAEAVVDGPDSPAKPATQEAALAALASLIGAVTIARATGNEDLAKSVASAMRERLLGNAA